MMPNENESTTEAVTETPPPSNGVAEPGMTEKGPVKPWLLAGFKSRDEWRASKGQKTGKPKKPAVVKASEIKEKTVKPKKPKAKKKAIKAASTKKSKPAKSMVAKPGKWASKHMEQKSKKMKAKKLKAAKLAAKSKGKEAKHKKPAPPKKGSVKDASMKPVAVAELSPRCKKVFLAIGKGKMATIAEIQKKACPSLPHAKGNSLVRNQLRFLRVHRMYKLLGDGKYKRVA